MTEEHQQELETENDSILLHFASWKIITTYEKTQECSSRLFWFAQAVCKRIATLLCINAICGGR